MSSERLEISTITENTCLTKDHRRLPIPSAPDALALALALVTLALASGSDAVALALAGSNTLALPLASALNVALALGSTAAELGSRDESDTAVTSESEALTLALGSASDPDNVECPCPCPHCPWECHWPLSKLCELMAEGCDGRDDAGSLGGADSDGPSDNGAEAEGMPRDAESLADGTPRVAEPLGTPRDAESLATALLKTTCLESEGTTAAAAFEAIAARTKAEEKEIMMNADEMCVVKWVGGNTCVRHR
ncbi:hypothetical protein GGX14DRAFT_468991 [Mycena pura]|uniref:Uncharacterized protein n=1 Tax=Mycena pura TaxID=153505 RepID=A0AAD6Y830_9AGAR|nr:hypothetical protein GGX14DRAFT_468991 [Mycena pura]